MPASAKASSSTHHRPEDLISLLSSAASDDGEAKLKVLRDLKNQIIGNRTKKLSYIKLGVVPSVVSILSSAVSAACYGAGDVDFLLVQSAAAIGSFACGVDAGVKAVLDAGAFPHLLSLISHPNEKVVDAGARSLRMIYQSKLAPKECTSFAMWHLGTSFTRKRLCTNSCHKQAMSQSWSSSCCIMTADYG